MLKIKNKMYLIMYIEIQKVSGELLVGEPWSSTTSHDPDKNANSFIQRKIVPPSNHYCDASDGWLKSRFL